MANFDAGAVVDVLDYDFTAFLPGVQGVIPEPSGQAIETLTEVLRRVMPTKTDENGKMTLDIDAVEREVKEGSDVESILYTAIADFCQQTPNVEQLRRLPYRVQRAFIGWLLGKFFSPEA